MYLLIGSRIIVPKEKCPLPTLNVTLTQRQTLTYRGQFSLGAIFRTPFYIINIYVIIFIRFIYYLSEKSYTENESEIWYQINLTMLYRLIIIIIIYLVTLRLTL